MSSTRAIQTDSKNFIRQTFVQATQAVAYYRTWYFPTAFQQKKIQQTITFKIKELSYTIELWLTCEIFPVDILAGTAKLQKFRNFSAIHLPRMLASLEKAKRENSFSPKQHTSTVCFDV